ncbi:MAG: hypothetical protein V5783_12690, partial [Pontiella sp.]
MGVHIKRYIAVGVLAGAISANVSADVLYQDYFDNDSLAVNTNGMGGGAINRTILAHAWTDDGDATFVTSGTSFMHRAILYSKNTFQSDAGFKLTVNYTTGLLSDLAAHNLSFGLISSDTDISTYAGYNPFEANTNIYSIGVNLTADGGVAVRGLNFTDGSIVTNLDQSGTHAEFKAGERCEVTIEIGVGGYWCYRIDGVYEASGVLLEGFDLSNRYRVVVYGQDDHGGEKSIQAIRLETAYALGERAASLRGNWSGGAGALDQIKNFRTLDSIGINFSDGATQSALHFAPHKLLESLSEGDTDEDDNRINLVVPLWGDLSLDDPENDTFLERILEIKAAGFNVKGYTNSENFIGSNHIMYDVFCDRWKTWCDTNEMAQAFINSQPFHTGVWNRTTGLYEDASATYPNRKYMFCYAEYVLKDYALRYGTYFGSWIFDDGATMEQNGDHATSGLIEEQRIYQAFANAIHAGNPEVPIAFNNGRSTVNYNSSPYAHAIRFEDFTFGHAFGGNNDHASKTGSQFTNNYRHVTRMMETDGYVHEGGAWEWDDLIVGNFHSKLSTTAWKYGPVQAWEKADFYRWNLEAIQAGGHMTWGGSIPRSGTVPVLYDWAYNLLKGLDDHLAQFGSPGAPNWARAYTVLPDATMGEAYYHILVEEEDVWDPEGDAIVAITALGDAASWLSIREDPNDPGHWVMSGTPRESTASEQSFILRATDVAGQSGDRVVELQLNENLVDLIPDVPGHPFWITASMDPPGAYRYQTYRYTLVRGKNFEDLDGDPLKMKKVRGASWLTLKELAPDIWQLSGTPDSSDVGLHTVELCLSDGITSVIEPLQIDVTDTRFLAMEQISIKGGAYWTDLEFVDENEDFTYYNSGGNYDYRSLAYSTQAFQSKGGFRLTVNYTIGSISDSLAHNFSFGLIRADADLSTYSGFNPFKVETNVYSLGVNLTADGDDRAQGLTFTDGSACTTLDQSGDHVQFAIGVSTEVIIEIGHTGAWSYSIGGITEASGVIPGGFDLSESYHITFYGQDDNGGGKSIQSMELDLLDAPGSFGDWISSYGLSVDDAQLDADGENGGKGDGYDNLAEYALGMDPTKSDAGSRDWIALTSAGGTNYFEWIHYRRSDYVEQGL